MAELEVNVGSRAGLEASAEDEILYQGSYRVAADFEQKELETFDRRMKQNLIIEPIGVLREKNAMCGDTVTIGNPEQDDPAEITGRTNQVRLSDGRVLLDLTQDTALETDVLQGKQFHRADGVPSIGCLQLPLMPALPGVTFYDTDGSVIAVWQPEEVAEKTALPENPLHAGRVSQGWNWSLQEIQSYVAAYPSAALAVGQMYLPEDGTTKITVLLSEYRKEPSLGLGVNGNVTINWGDGSEPDTLTGTSLSTVRTVKHSYAQGGRYCISVDVTEGKSAIIGTSSATSRLFSKGTTNKGEVQGYSRCVERIELGSNMELGSYALSYLFGLREITMPHGLESIGGHAMEYCYSLVGAVIPDTVTEVGTYAFDHCIHAAFQSIPRSASTLGSYCFSTNERLSALTLPDTVTEIKGSLALNCYQLESLTFAQNVTAIANAAFQNCYRLAEGVLPETLTTFGSIYANCVQLDHLTIPAGIGTLSSCFSGMKHLARIRFEGETPPTAPSSTFGSANLPSDYALLVPWSRMNAYQTASGYPNAANYPYLGFATFEREATLPATDPGGILNLTWYATEEDAIRREHPITAGTGKEIYSRGTAASA